MPPEDASRHDDEREAEAGVNMAVITAAPPPSLGLVASELGWVAPGLADPSRLGYERLRGRQGREVQSSRATGQPRLNSAGWAHNPEVAGSKSRPRYQVSAGQGLIVGSGGRAF